MLCDTKIHTQLLSDGLGEKLEENPNPPPRFPPLKKTSPTPEAVKRYHTQWRKNHVERYREYSRKSYRKCYDKIRQVRGTEEYKRKMREYLKRYRAEHPEKHKESLRRSYKKYRAKRLTENKSPERQARRRELYQLRKKEICARKCALMKTPKYKEKANERLRKRRRENVQFALADSLRATMNRAFRRNWIKKPHRTEALLGCSFSDAKRHIESQFVNGMSWQNRRSFVVDHIIPVVAFDLRDPEEVRWAFNWRNLQPITFHDNAVKSDSLPNPLPSWLPAHIAERINSRQQERRPASPF